jgi:UrcA family protein
MNTSTHQRILNSLAICGITTLLAGGVAAMAEPADPYFKGASIKVSYGDLALDRAAGAAELYRRIDVAARRVCGGNVTWSYGVFAVRAAEECRKIAVANAVQHVNNARLTALHNDKSSKQRSYG